MDSESIYTAVRDRYTATVLSPSNPSHSSSVAQAFGYSASDLASIPVQANLGVSCGNPLALANLRPGETVVDLGCGAGFDCFLAAKKVGPEGKVIGVDMNEEMLSKARHNASKISTQNTTFIHSRITAINLPDSTADVVISNCVINLVPHAEKHAVFKEMYRLLKPGGRLAVSDILTRKDLPESMKNDLALYVACIAGASRKEDYEAWLGEAGFEDVHVVDAGVDLNMYTRGSAEEGAGAGTTASCCQPVKIEVESKEFCAGKDREVGVLEGMKSKFGNTDLNEWAGSFKIFAVKT